MSLILSISKVACSNQESRDDSISIHMLYYVMVLAYPVIIKKIVSVDVIVCCFCCFCQRFYYEAIDHDEQSLSTHLYDTRSDSEIFHS